MRSKWEGETKYIMYMCKSCEGTRFTAKKNKFMPIKYFLSIRASVSSRLWLSSVNKRKKERERSAEEICGCGGDVRRFAMFFLKSFLTLITTFLFLQIIASKLA